MSEPMTDSEVDASAREHYAAIADDKAPQKKRRKGTSPTQRTMTELRKRGWTAQVVERRLPRMFVTQDLFGVIDIIAIVPPIDVDGNGWPEPSTIIGIQATTGPHHADRRDKILAEPRAKLWVEAGARLELWTWSQRGDRGKRKLWTLRVEVFTAASWDPAPAP